MPTDRPPTPHLITIPGTDEAFREHVLAVAADLSPAGLQERLRRIFPRVVVRERALTGEPSAWYVYRDGGWRPPEDHAWWQDGSLPRVVLDRDGWLTEVSATAGGVLGIDAVEVPERHFTDFVAPGTLDDSLALFAAVDGGNDLTATVLLRPTSGDVIAVDLHASKAGDEVVGVFRLASDVDIAFTAPVPTPLAVTTVPSNDVAFRAYTLRALDRMSEPTVDGLVLRLRRLYPHAAVATDGGTWIVDREPNASQLTDEQWWRDQGLPRVRYDAQALILEANDAAQGLLGRGMVGRYWQDFVTPGSTDEVGVMLEILAETGAAESRFRMPRADGSLVEFDSYTTVTGEEFVTVMKPTDS